jgi:hypothetical protein
MPYFHNGSAVGTDFAFIQQRPAERRLTESGQGPYKAFLIRGLKFGTFTFKRLQCQFIVPLDP